MYHVQVAKGLPTVVTIASKNEAVAKRAQLLLSSPRFRCYTSGDVAGLQISSPHLHVDLCLLLLVCVCSPCVQCQYLYVPQMSWPIISMDISS